MKKQQKIVELRTAAKLKVSELEAKIAFARCKAAEERSGVLRERANKLEGLEAGSTERFDVLAKYRADLADVEWMLADTVAQYKSKIQQTKSECEQQCAAAEDDPEPENQQPAEEPTVWVDDSQHSAVITARRMLRKLPRIAPGCAFDISIRQFGEGISIGLQAYNPKRNGNNFENINLFSSMTAEEQEKAAAEWLERAAVLMNYEDNSHVAEPLSRALDAVFGGNPLNDIPTVRKEGGDE